MKLQKITFAGLLMAATLFGCQKEEITSINNELKSVTINRATPEDGAIIMKHIVARPKKSCFGGLWICKVPSILKVGETLLQREVISYVKVVDGKLHLSFTTPLPENETSFYAEAGEELQIEGETAKLLSNNKVSSFSLKTGNYPIDFSKNPYGTVILDINEQ